ncbi:WD40-repeat-containing domain protein [Kockovaella imperatae]|uniref:WD40-repeat-containing domain protein n=1 Tax=Kockovaella imperatae TaxID=4999 RepID=A0A1Y1U7P1_9TREE|nr:WD40-repeat-containing domain protein [Kockovaella imperatae]ORX33564.1 WD40-repeat-containing domain protein [Kockovaella imperatae]
MAKSKHPRQSKGRVLPYGKPQVKVSFDSAGSKSHKTSIAVKSEATQGDKHVAKSNGKGKEKAAAPEIELQTPQNGSQAAGPSTFIIVAGSYEKLLYGIEGSYSSSTREAELKPIFIFPAHLACVKAVAASPGGKWLATGSEDEFVKVWDLRRRKEVGSLSQHQGSITSLHFPTSAHLLTTSTDSTLSLFRTSDWALLKSLKGHSGRVNHVDVHPTGRVALSVGKDKTLKMWDLMRGRGASSLPLGEEAELVRFSPRGTHFAVLYPRKIELYSLTMKLLHTLETKSRFNTLLFASLPRAAYFEDPDEEEMEMLFVGNEKGSTEGYWVDLGDVEDDSEEEDEDGDQDQEEGGSGSINVDLRHIVTLTGHSNRIKAISSLRFMVPNQHDVPRPTVLLTSVSSDGKINLYDLGSYNLNNLIEQHKGSATAEISTHDPVASHDTKGTRLTCVFLAEGRKGATGLGESEVKQNIGPDEDEDDDDDGEEEEEEEEDMYDQASDDDQEEEEEDGIEVELEEEEDEDVSE